MTDNDCKDVKSGVLVVANSLVAGMRSPSSEDVSGAGKKDLDQGQVLRNLGDSGIALATIPLRGGDLDSIQSHSSRVLTAGSSEGGDEGFVSCSDSVLGVPGSSVAVDDVSGGGCSAVSDFENEVFENLSKAEVFGSTDFTFVGKKVTDGDAPEKGRKHESEDNANGDAPDHLSDEDAQGYVYEYVDTDDDLDDMREEEQKKGGENSEAVSLSEGMDRIYVKRTDAFRLLRPHRPPKYENIIRILRASRKKARGRALQRSESVESDEDDVHNLLRSISSDHEDECRDEILDIDSGVYGSSVESTSHMPSAPPTPPASSRRWASPNDLPEQQSPPPAPPKISPAAEAERLTMYRCILSSIVESETIYLECLDVVLQYMKALKATLTTSQPVISPDDFSTVFYRISELHSTHSAFLSGLKERTAQWDGTNAIGELFRVLASKLDVYASFLQNYPRAIETVRRCSAQSSQFADITRSIKLRSLQGQAQSLEDLLHRPVARVQKNALVLHDLLKYTPEHHPDHETLREALRLTQNFLTHLSMLHTEAMFPAQDRPQRHLVRNSFIVELVEGHRKLRHLFLFNDVIVCAKYKPTGRSEKFTFEVKWYISLHDIAVLNDSGPETLKESNPPNIVALKSQASTVRDQLRRMENIADNKGVSRMNQARNEKNRKKLAELEAQLVLASPNLPFRISKRNGSIHTFLITSEYERDQWGEAIKVLQDNTPGVGGSSLTLQELQNWITACRSFLKTNMGSFLLKSGRDDSLLLGDLHIVVSSLHGLTSAANMFVCFEVDSYGHFFRKAKTRVSEGVEPHWNQDFIIELEGSQTLRILCYEEHPKLGLQLRGKAHLELSRTWLNDTLSERRVSLQDLVLVLSLKFLPPEATLRRVPTGKSSGLFGANIAHICRREKRSVPFIVTRCVREVERRGMQEVGIYRVSGLASDITKLKKSFESNPYEAEQLIKEVDIHSVTGLLKLFLRELPEALYTDELYPRFFEAYSAADPEYRKTTLLKLFSSLPQLNQSIIAYLLEHLVKIHHTENMNKMSLHNLATVFGPTLIRPGAKTGNPSPAEQLAAGTVDVMAQAGILHFFLLRRAHGEPIQGVNQ